MAEQLSQASPDLLRQMVQTFAEALMSADADAVCPFDDFNPPAKPRDAETYREFRRLSIEFIEARNRRIDAIVNHATAN